MVSRAETPRYAAQQTVVGGGDVVVVVEQNGGQRRGVDTIDLLLWNAGGEFRVQCVDALDDEHFAALELQLLAAPLTLT